MDDKNYYGLEPIKEWHTNTVLKGYDDIPDLHITKFDDQIFSVWKIKSIWWRIKFLFSGKIYLGCLGSTHPPVSLTIGSVIRRGADEQ